MTARTLLSGALGVALLLPACEPCSGMLGCETEPHVSATGRIIERDSGDPVQGVELTFSSVDGVALEHPAVTVTTGPDGRFHYRAVATGAGTAVVEAEVRPPDRSSYHVRGLELRTSTVRGDGVDVGRWLVEPVFAYVGELWLRSEKRRKLRHARVEFRRTGGVPMVDGPIRTRADRFGRFLLTPEAERPGRIEGELTIRHADLREPYTRDLTIESDHVDRPIDLDAVLLIGPSLAYVGELFYRSGEGPVPGSDARATFRRTGGIEVDPDTFTVETNHAGEFRLETYTRRSGELRGELILRPGGERRPDTVPEVRMETFSADTVRLLDRWVVGEKIDYRARLVHEDSGEPVGGAEIEFRRTDGIAVEPDTFTVTTDDDGFFPLRPHTDQRGTLEGEIEVRLEPPREPVVIGGLRLETFAADETRFYEEFEI